MSYVALTFTLIFIAIAVLVSMWQRIGIEKEIFVGTVRSAVQLLAIGYVLAFVFHARHPLLILGILAVMITVATLNAGKRGKGLAGIRRRIAVAIASTEALTIGLLLLLKIIPPTPQYIIPLSGMTIGNAMVVCGLFLNGMKREIETSAGEIEAMLALGAGARQAIHNALRHSVRASMIPTIDSMKTVGLVQLPGMMTGMIVAGANPIEAVRYQILIMFAFSSSAAITSLILSMLSYRLWFTKDLRLAARSKASA